MVTLSALIASEIADFFAGLGAPGAPDIQNGEAQRQLTDRVLSLVSHQDEAAQVARAALDYIDAIPAKVAAGFPAMPGFSRDWAESALSSAGLPAAPVTDNTAPQFEALAENTEPCVICGIVSSHPEGWHYCKGEPPIFTCPACGEQSYEDLGYGALRCADCGEHFTKSTGAK